MSEPEFNISLGGGLYMDSNGDVRSGPSPAAPTYPMPGGGVLPITKEAFEKAITGATKALQGIVKVLPDPKDPDSIKRFTDLGIPDNLINLLGTLGGVAARFAKVIPIVGAVVVVLEEIIHLFSSAGGSPLEFMIKAQFAAVHTHLKADEMQQKLYWIDQAREKITNALAQVSSYIEEAEKYQPSLAALEQLRGTMLRLRDEEVPQAVGFLLDEALWLFVYLPESFQWASWFSDLLKVMPGGSPPHPPQPAVAVQSYENRFEHGMMIPTVIHALQSYLMLIKAIAPEYRSTGACSYELRDFATRLEILTEKMRQETLARTVYPIGLQGFLIHTFQTGLDSYEVIDPGWGPPFVAPSCTRFPVGAVDLCSFTDAFLNQQRQAAIAAGAADPMYGPAVIGTMNLRWIPPAVLERLPKSPFGPHYRITNPDECAAAANAQSDVDYAKLLLSSGYLNLVQMTTLMRHLATEPDRSETVNGDVILLRNPQTATDATVESEDIVFTGVIKSSARRELANCRAIAPISTQPLREDRVLPYRIVLRTLRSIVAPNHWRDPDYGDFYSTRYEDDPAHPGFLRLVTETKDSWALAEYELVASTSPKELVQKSSAEVDVDDPFVKLTAHTFDWYIPVESPSLSEDRLTAALRSMGWSGAKRPPIPQKTLEGKNPFGDPLQGSAMTLADELAIVDTHIFGSGAQDWKGQRRDMKETTVHIKYELQWKADRLRITLENLPTDRNYIVFLVVEETFPVSGQILHTALPVPMNGQLTYVPRTFFDEEEEAINKANRIVLDIATRYSESGPVGPEDPFIGKINPGDLYSAVGLQRLANLAEQHQPTLLRHAVQRYRASGGSMKGDVPDFRS